MKTSEFKLRVKECASQMIDVYFAENTLIDNLVNSTLKIFININIDKANGLFEMFQDENGEIDANTIVNAYAERFGDGGSSFDIKQFVKNDFIRELLPNKSLIITREDILKIVEE